MGTEAKAILGLLVLAVMIYMGAKNEFALIKKFLANLRQLGFDFS